MTKSKENNPLKNAIFNAIKHKNANAVKMLLTNPNPHHLAEAVSDNLYWACVNKDEEIVKMLLQKGANPNTFLVQGRLPLHKACADGNKNIAEMLLAAGAGFNHMDESSGILFEKIGGTELWFFLELVEGCRKGDLNFIYNGAKYINKPRLTKFIDWKTSIKPSDIYYNSSEVFNNHLKDVRNLKTFVEKNNKLIFIPEEREENLKKIEDMSILTLILPNNIIIKAAIKEVSAITDDFVPSHDHLKVAPVEVLGGDNPHIGE